MKSVSFFLGAASLLALLPGLAVAQSADASVEGPAAAVVPDLPDAAWRTVDPEQLLLIETAYGTVGVELYPEIAPLHIERIKLLTRQGFYDDVPFHRVIRGFMNQTGDGELGNGAGGSDLPDLPAEFTFRRSEDMVIAPDEAAGFYKALPVSSQPSAQAWITPDGKVEAHGFHCEGVVSAARTNDPNTANSQFFLMRGQNENLDKTYSIWGATVMGRNILTRIRVGTVGDDPSFVPDRMSRVRIAADLPEGERPTVQVIDTAGAEFQNWIALQSYDDICEIELPTRTL
jgi:peptidylprolyl isomerase